MYDWLEQTLFISSEDHKQLWCIQLVMISVPSFCFYKYYHGKMPEFAHCMTDLVSLTAPCRYLDIWQVAMVIFRTARHVVTMVTFDHTFT